MGYLSYLTMPSGQGAQVVFPLPSVKAISALSLMIRLSLGTLGDFNRCLEGPFYLSQDQYINHSI